MKFHPVPEFCFQYTPLLEEAVEVLMPCTYSVLEMPDLLRV